MSIIQSKNSSVITPNITYPKNTPLGTIGVCTTTGKPYPNEIICVPQLMAQGGSLHNNFGERGWGSTSSEYIRNTITEVCCDPPKTKQNQNSADSSYIIEQRKRIAAGKTPINRPRTNGISPDYQSSKDVSIWAAYRAGNAVRSINATNSV